MFSPSKLYTSALAAILCTFMTLSHPFCLLNNESRLSACECLCRLRLSFTARNVRGLFSQLICANEERITHPVPIKVFLLLSPDTAMFFHPEGAPPSSPCPTLSAHTEHVSQRTLPEVTSQKESFMPFVDSYTSINQRVKEILWLCCSSSNHTPGSRSYSDHVDTWADSVASTSSYSNIGCMCKRRRLAYSYGSVQ